jgi:DNA mismatch repair protein MutH
LLYELNEHSTHIVKEDWEGIQYKVETGNADQLSESHSKILGASTSGSGKLVKYGNNKKAKQRSYSLKHNYLKLFYDENKGKQKYSSLNIVNQQEPHEFVIEKFNKELFNKNLKTIVDKYQVEFSSAAKSSFSLLINRVLKVDDKKKIRELEENGIIIKTIPVNKRNKPWEAMSFPKFSLVDLLFEDWDGQDYNEAVFKNMISKSFIFIPILKEKIKIKKKDAKTKYKFKDWTTWEIGKSVYWKATEEELQIIEREWLKAKKIVEKGVKVTRVKYGKGTRQENNLLKM